MTDYLSVVDRGTILPSLVHHAPVETILTKESTEYTEVTGFTKDAAVV